MDGPPEDPLVRATRALMPVLIAVIGSLMIAAMIGGAMPFDYEGRAWTYSALLLYNLAGAVIVFRMTYQGEQPPISAARVLRWLLSLWIWPLLVLAHWRR